MARAGVAIATLGALAALLLPHDVFEPLYGHSSLLTLVTLAAGVRAWWRRRRYDPSGTWGWILVGILGFFAYDAAWYVAWLSGRTLDSGLADLGNVLFAMLVLVGLFRGWRAPSGWPELLRTILDASILATSAATLVLATVSFAGGEVRPMHQWRDAVLLLSPLVDLATLIGLALLWVRRDTQGLPVWAQALGMSLLFGLFGDAWYALPSSVTQSSPWFVAAAWYGSWAAVGFGAAHATLPAREPSRRARVARLPYLLVVACYALLLMAVLLDERRTAIVLSVALGVQMTLVLARQLLSLHEVMALQKERLLAQSDARLAALVRHGSDMLLIIGRDFTIRYASPSHLDVLGIPPELLIGRDITKEIHRDDAPEACKRMQRLLDGETPRESMVVRLRDSRGEWRWVESVGANLLHEPSIGGLVVNGRDISERKALEVQLIDQALRDPLTGLGNRRLFGDRLSHALARRQRHAGAVAVLLIDLDHFKIVNDSLGHARGDALLVAVANRLQGALRSEDTVARLGGDEFAILLEDLQRPGEAEAAATRIQEALQPPVRLGDREVSVRASIGIAWASDQQDAHEVLTDADVAMYGAKASGRSRVELFSSTMRAEIAERHHIEAGLRRALEHEEFELAYQPVIDLRSGQVAGAEALVRWNHPERGMVLPGRFIAIAEETDLIVEIGRVVLQRAARDARQFVELADPSVHFRVAVNVSARQFHDTRLIDDVTRALAGAGVDGSVLAIELTESVLVANDGELADRLQALRALGVRIALDDFGTGYSALSYLRRFPIDVLKVDKSFVSWEREDTSQAGVTRAIVAMGQSLSMRTLAEGIESREQLAWLQSLGCALGQGYFFSRPVAALQFAALLRQWKTLGRDEEVRSAAAPAAVE